ncbi:1900_t:CDS:1, partial [Acaulospora morrowiae]
ISNNIQDFKTVSLSADHVTLLASSSLRRKTKNLIIKESFCTSNSNLGVPMKSRQIDISSLLN